ncbi:MAG: 5'/3'-nucleotidase SurE [Chloroflexota bacterium]
MDDPTAILVTNDDGVESRGLLALKQALEPLGDVYVVAPETNQSAVCAGGHQKTFMRLLRVRERTLADGSRAWSVDGSPTDAVSLAFLGYFDVVFDVVASGINYGANLGDDVTYSGTVSAAMEAVINECLCLRHVAGVRHPTSPAGRVAQRVAVNILEHGLSPGQLLNVNVPANVQAPTASRSSRSPGCAHLPGPAHRAARPSRRPLLLGSGLGPQRPPSAAPTSTRWSTAGSPSRPSSSTSPRGASCAGSAAGTGAPGARHRGRAGGRRDARPPVTARHARRPAPAGSGSLLHHRDVAVRRT